MSLKCSSCGMEAAPDAFQCGLCRAALPRRRHRRQGRPSFPKPAAPLKRPLPPLPADWRKRTVTSYLEQLSRRLVPAPPPMPGLPRWFRVVSWLMFGGALATGMALAGLLLGLSHSP